MAPYQAVVLVTALAVHCGEPSFGSEVLRWVHKGETVQVLDGPVISEGAAWVRVVAETTPCEAWCQMTDMNKRAMIR